MFAKESRIRKGVFGIDANSQQGAKSSQLIQHQVREYESSPDDVKPEVSVQNQDHRDQGNL